MKRNTKRRYKAGNRRTAPHFKEDIPPLPLLFGDGRFPGRPLPPVPNAEDGAPHPKSRKHRQPSAADDFRAEADAVRARAEARARSAAASKKLYGQKSVDLSTIVSFYPDAHSCPTPMLFDQALAGISGYDLQASGTAAAVEKIVPKEREARRRRKRKRMTEEEEGPRGNAYAALTLSDSDDEDGGKGNVVPPMPRPMRVGTSSLWREVSRHSDPLKLKAGIAGMSNECRPFNFANPTFNLPVKTEVPKILKGGNFVDDDDLSL
mmetsp:Transcript_29735/g.68253  ORF Transcript_29735/g.68253 Transcript_29735/m.68253 type:complete len:264 (-) Transcript_29735:96-887(-)